MNSLMSFNQWINENFMDGRNPQDKGDSKRLGVPTKAFPIRFIRNQVNH